MEASELADKLDECMGHALSAEEALYPDVADIWLDKYEECCRENRETVIKSLRFAADMEKIYEHCGGEIVIRKRKESQQEIQYLSGSVTRSKGDDIYSAARKAVEALEGGK